MAVFDAPKRKDKLMKTFKKGVIPLLILALLLPHFASAKQAVTITQLREQAEHWQQTYQAHGREIKVDITPHVPATDAVPILACRLMNPQPLPDPEGIYTIYQREKDYILALEADGEAVTGKRGYVYQTARYSHFEYDKRFLPASPLTLREMEQLMLSALKRAGLDASKVYTPLLYSLSEAVYKNKDGSQDKEPGMINLEYYQAIRVIPLVGDFYKAYGSKIPRDFYVPFPTLNAYIQSDSKYSIGYHSVLEDIEELAADVPLVDFDTIKQAVEAEIMAGRLRQVFALTFGYALYRDKDNAKFPFTGAHRFYTLPVWTVDCIHVDSPKRNLRDYSNWEINSIDPRNVLEYKRLLINAQTGELSSPDTRGKNLDVYQGFIPWKQGQK